jgi:hypothetical protein
MGKAVCAVVAMWLVGLILVAGFWTGLAYLIWHFVLGK